MQRKGKARRGSASLTSDLPYPVGPGLAALGQASAEHCLLCSGPDRLFLPYSLSPALPKLWLLLGLLASPRCAASNACPAHLLLLHSLAHWLSAFGLAFSASFFPLSFLLGILPWASASSFPWRPPRAPSAPRNSPGPRRQPG